MGVSQEQWMPKLRDIVKQQESEREERLALSDKLSAFLGEAVVEVDNLSSDPAFHGDSANADFETLRRQALDEALRKVNRSLSEKDLMTLEANAVDVLWRQASQIYEGGKADDQSGLVSRLQQRAGVLGNAFKVLDVLPSAFTHSIVLEAARKLKSHLGVSSGTAQSLLKLALQSAQAFLLTSSRPL